MSEKKPKKEVEKGEEESIDPKLSKIIDNLGIDVETADQSEIDDSSTSHLYAFRREDYFTEEPLEKEVEVKRVKDDYIMEPSYTPVYVNWKALKRIIGYANRYANPKDDMKKWREVYGILIGAVEENTLVVVKDAIPVCVGGKTGVELEPIHYVDLSQIDASVYERALEDRKTDFIIGWWHTHPGFGFFFSEVDCYTHLGYQVPNPFAVGLIFDHTEKTPEFPGLAGLRLEDPDEGILSDYKIIELHYEDEVRILNKKIAKVIKKVEVDMDSVLKELKYIDNVLRKKALAQLQRNFGLILVPKRDVKETEDEEEADELEDKIYVWDPDYFEKKYRIPKFREKMEKQLKDYEEDLKSQDEVKKFNDKLSKYRKKMESTLEKANAWHTRLMDDFAKRLEKIFPLYDYLDTEERKIIEHFEERIEDYSKILETLNSRSEFKNIDPPKEIPKETAKKGPKEKSPKEESPAKETIKEDTSDAVVLIKKTAKKELEPKKDNMSSKDKK